MSGDRGGRDGRRRDDPEPPDPPRERPQDEEERDRDQELKETFPSSDPPAEGGPGV